MFNSAHVGYQVGHKISPALLPCAADSVWPADVVHAAAAIRLAASCNIGYMMAKFVQHGRLLLRVIRAAAAAAVQPHYVVKPRVRAARGSPVGKCGRGAAVLPFYYKAVVPYPVARKKIPPLHDRVDDPGGTRVCAAQVARDVDQRAFKIRSIVQGLYVRKAICALYLQTVGTRRSRPYGQIRPGVVGRITVCYVGHTVTPLRVGKRTGPCAARIPQRRKSAGIGAGWAVVVCAHLHPARGNIVRAGKIALGAQRSHDLKQRRGLLPPLDRSLPGHALAQADRAGQFGQAGALPWIGGICAPGYVVQVRLSRPCVLVVRHGRVAGRRNGQGNAVPVKPDPLYNRKRILGYDELCLDDVRGAVFWNEYGCARIVRNECVRVAGPHVGNHVEYAVLGRNVGDVGVWQRIDRVRRCRCGPLEQGMHACVERHGQGHVCHLPHCRIVGHRQAGRMEQGQRGSPPDIARHARFRSGGASRMRAVRHLRKGAATGRPGAPRAARGMP